MSHRSIFKPMKDHPSLDEVTRGADVSKPVRIQRKRSKGWVMPHNAVCVDRSTKWGNPFIVNPRVKPGSKSGGIYICVPTIDDAIACYGEYLDQKPALKSAALAELRGKNLACWCKLGEPCHADVLLEIANQ